MKSEPEKPAALSDLQDQHTEMWHQDLLGTRPIKKEERLTDLIGTCDVEEPKVENMSEDEFEFELHPEKPSDGMSLAVVKKEMKLGAGIAIAVICEFLT